MASYRSIGVWIFVRNSDSEVTMWAIRALTLASVGSMTEPVAPRPDNSYEKLSEPSSDSYDLRVLNYCAAVAAMKSSTLR